MSRPEDEPQAEETTDDRRGPRYPWADAPQQGHGQQHGGWTGPQQYGPQGHPQQQYGAPGHPQQQYGAAPQQYRPQGPSSDDKTLAVVAHVGGIFTSIVAPLVIYLIKKDESPFVRDHAAAALNAQIIVGIIYVASIPLFFVLIGFLTIFLAPLLSIAWGIQGAVNASKFGRPGLTAVPSMMS